MKTLIVSVLPLLLLFTFHFRSSHSNGMKLPPNCTRQCGDIDITYPFGIEEGCYLEGFKVTCNDKGGPPVLDRVQLPIKKIELPEKVILLIKGLMAVDKQITAKNGSQLIPFDSSTKSYNENCIKLEWPFTVSGRWTKFVALGCDTKAYINDDDTGNFASECEYQWTLGGARNVHGGLGHCRSMIPDNHTRFCYNVTNFFNYINCSCTTKYSFAGLVEDEYHFNESLLMNFTSNVSSTDQLGLPLAAIWAMEGSTGSKCGSNTFSNISRRGSGHVCYCNDGGDGNPYLDGKGGCRHEGTDPRLIVALAGLGLAVSLLGASWSYDSFLQKKLIQMAQAAFKDNGGPFLQELIAEAINDATYESGATSDSAQTPTIFTQENLEKAIKLLKKGSDLAMRIRGGIRSTGKLPDDRKIDMRPFKIEEKEELQPFLKEIMTLCRVNHLNVVKLLGCCLETTTDPWLVYEYVSNLTLYNHLHDADPETHLRWKDLLKIAKGTARALAYLHARRVWHRDVRSSNIVLDENGNPKVVEFGVVRVLSSVSYVKQSIGYLDPEYIYTKQLTDKSDVYSFGVLLVELLTGEDPNSDQSKKKGGSLTKNFISEMNENRLELVVKDGLPEEAEMDQLQALAKLAEDCLKFSGKERPAMNEVMGKLCLIGDGDEQAADRVPEEGGEGQENNGDDGNWTDPVKTALDEQEMGSSEGLITTVINFAIPE